MIKAVLFDLDGTLVDSLPFIISNYELVFQDMGIPWKDGEVMHWIGRPLRDIARHFAKEREEEFLQIYQKYYNRDHDLYVCLFPGTLEMLETLKAKGIHLGIVTSKGREGTRRSVELTSLNRYMEVIVTAHDVNRHKPFPDPVLEALCYLRTLPDDALYIGDSCFDIQAGKKAGTRTLGVTWGISSREELTQLEPDGILESWSDLYAFLECPVVSSQNTE